MTDANCAPCMKRAKLLLQKFRRSATDFVFFVDEKMFSVALPDNRQNKVSCRLWELLKKLSIFFSAGTARSAAAWPPINFACVPQLFETCEQLFSGNSYINLFAVYLFKYKLFIKSLSTSLNTMLIVDRHRSDVYCDEFPMPQIDCKNK